MKLTLPAGIKGRPSFDLKAIAEDFKRLNPKDVGTWPLAPRIVALALALILIVAAGWAFLWSDQLDTLEKKQAEELKQKDEYLEKSKKAVNIDLYKQQLNEIDKTFGVLLRQLPKKSEMEALLTEINQAGLGQGLQFESFVPGQEAIKDFYAEMPITVKLTGNYKDFGAFATDIAKLTRIVTLNDITIAPAATGGKLSLDTTAKTFRYLDEEETAKVAAEKNKKNAKTTTAAAKPGDKK